MEGKYQEKAFNYQCLDCNKQFGTDNAKSDGCPYCKSYKYVSAPPQSLESQIKE